ncbi:MAG: preprotein translocase subunit SecE [Alphaproteobacteria bacterium]|nr:MAG: preprotein translocase subunit SecE [Alphaproteobacteria bacterium]
MSFSSVKNFMRSILEERKNLRWPKKDDVIKSVYLVIVFSAFCSVLLFLVDAVFSTIIRWVCNL